MKTKVKASTMVKPTTATPATTVWMSNVDVIMPSIHVCVVYFYRSTGVEDSFDPTVLKASLSQTLVEFYPLAGRLREVNGRIEIDCNGEGALFVEAECDGALDDFTDFLPRPEIKLVPNVDYSQGISTFPLLVVQITRLRCGGVCVGVGTEHHAMDAFSIGLFMNTWAEIARGCDVSTKPFLDRRVLAARSPPQPQFAHAEYLLPPTIATPKNCEVMLSVFKTTADQLNALKSKCQQHEGDKVKYTTYETLAGHVWRCVSKARGLPIDQETKLYIPVNGRSRLRPPLPQGYFGNAVFRATVVALCGELELNPLEFAVRKIHEAIARMDDDYLRSAIDFLETRGELDPRGLGSACYKCPNLGVVSWTRFGLYEIDFGWGRPIHVGLGGVPGEGNGVVLPDPTSEGSLFFAIVLPKEQMHLFEKLYYHI